MIEQLLEYRPPYITQQIGSDNIPILSYNFIKKYQNFPIPVLYSYEIEIMKGYLLALQKTNSIGFIALSIQRERELDHINRTLLDLMLYANEIKFRKPISIEAVIDPNLYEGDVGNVFYYLIQSYFTSFSFSFNYNFFKKNMDTVVSFVRPIIDMELGLNFHLSFSQDISKSEFNSFLTKLKLLKIFPNNLFFDTPKYFEYIPKQYNISKSISIYDSNNIIKGYDNYYFPGYLVKNGVAKEIDSFYNSREIIKKIGSKNSFSKFIKNYMEEL